MVFLNLQKNITCIKNSFLWYPQFLSNWPQTIILHHFYLFFAITCPDLLQLIVKYRDLFNPMHKKTNFSL